MPLLAPLLANARCDIMGKASRRTGTVNCTNAMSVLRPYGSRARLQGHTWFKQSLDADAHRPKLGNNNGAARRERASPAQVSMFTQRCLNALPNQFSVAATFEHSQVRVRWKINAPI